MMFKWETISKEAAGDLVQCMYVEDGCLYRNIIYNSMGCHVCMVFVPYMKKEKKK